MAVWVVAEAAQLALASDVMLAASAGTVFSGHAFGAVAHRKAAQPGLTWGRAVVAVAHESRPSPRQLPLRERIAWHLTATEPATRATAVLAGAVMGLVGFSMAAASGHLPALGAIAVGAGILTVVAVVLAWRTSRTDAARSVLSRRGMHLLSGAALREVSVTASMAVPVLVVAHTAGVPNVSLLEVLTVTMATRLAIAAVPVAGGLGIADITMIVGLAWVGIPVPVGIAAVLIWRAATIGVAVVSAATARRTEPVAIVWDSPSRDGVGRRLHRFAFAAMGWFPPSVRNRTRARVFDAMFSMSSDPWGYGDVPYERRKEVELTAAVDRLAAVIVEVGCADGHNLVALARSNPTATIIGTDVSEAAVRIASQRVVDMPRVRVVHATDAGDLERALPIKGRSV